MFVLSQLLLSIKIDSIVHIKNCVAPFFFFQPCCNSKLEVDYRFPLHFYLLNALSLFCGLLFAMGLRHRGPLISNSVNIRGDDKAFYIGLGRHHIPPLVYSSSRMGFHYIFSSPRSQPDSHCIHYGRRVDAAVSSSRYLIILNQWPFRTRRRVRPSVTMPHQRFPNDTT